MKPPSVSIIIPCYNAERYIAEAIQSALTQTHPDCEVIVIDDGSTDGSLEVIKSFGDKIRWETGPNRGGCAARNRGIELAQGGWIQFLDADDVLTPDCVAAKFAADPQDGELVCCGVEVLEGHDGATVKAGWGSSSYDLEALVRCGTPATPSPLHRKEWLLAVGGFRPELPCSQEYDLHLRLVFFLGLRFRVIPSVGVYIRPLPNSLSRSSSLKIPIARTNVLKNLLSRQSDWKVPHNAREHIYGALLFLARSLWRSGNIALARELVADPAVFTQASRQLAYRSRLVSAAAGLLGFERFERVHRAVSSLAHRA